MLELLSPAGSMEALRGAVQNGANAVYLGVDGFNARMGAKNFSMDALHEAVSYCHIRGVQVHLTLNTLCSDRELPHIAQTIANAAQCGVDAFIVQDFGVVSLCREIAPSVAIHASTQMSVHSLEGVRLAAEMGCTRVVLARELSREEIAIICRNSPIEIEVFGHGALCMCYSGQCYMSGIIGRRSGNRGQCAQPCRLPYGYSRAEQKYPLSLKDSCLLGCVGELASMGVASIKIEGRMKRAEYVAVVTQIYRKAMDGKKPTQQDYMDLDKAFSRDGFTDGYFQNRLGTNMFGVRAGEGNNKELFAAARATYENKEAPLVPVRFFAVMQRGEPAMLAAEDGQGRVAKCTGPIPQEAENRNLTEDELQARLEKTGGTPYYVTQCKMALDKDIMLPVSAINAMRREVLAKLTAERGQPHVGEINRHTKAYVHRNAKDKPHMTVSVSSFGQITNAMIQSKPKAIYVPIHILLENQDRVRALAQRVTLVATLPRIIWDSENGHLLAELERVGNLGVEAVQAGNLGQVAFARARGFQVYGDFGLNIFNAKSMEAAKAMGFSTATASFELLTAQIRDMSKALPTELIIYGRLPLMITENCVMKNRTGTCTCSTTTVNKLVDRKGEEFPIMKDGASCRNVMLNGKKLYLLDKKKDFENLGLWALRLQFTTENAHQVDRVLEEYGNGASFEPGQHTRGLYTRGVQ